MKRWSYATAIMLSLAGGTIMTGCIDNDEPYGIEQIRLATADFLKSKKAAVEAEAAAANAQVEIEKIKAETEKLKIEADAAIKAAQAKILEAIAAKRQAEADDIKAKTEAYIAEQKAMLDERIALAAINVKDAERKYQEAMYEFEKAKLENANAQKNELYFAVVAAFDYYMETLDNYNKANNAYLQAQRDYAASLVDLEWVEEKEGDKVVGGHFESPVYKKKSLLEENVAKAQAGVARAQAQIDLNNQAIADVKANDLYAVLEKYQAQKATNTEDIEKVKVELAAVKVENAPLYEKQDNLQKQIDDAMSAPIAIAPYTYKPDANLSIPNFNDEIVVVPEGETYTLANDNNYVDVRTTYENMILSMTDALMDDNDKAWTQAALNELERQLQEEETGYTSDKAAWENAKVVYNNGGEVNAAELPLEAEVEAAVAAYNAIGEKYAAVVQKKSDLLDTKEKAEKAYEAAVAKVYEAEPTNAAYKTFYEATVTASNDIEAAEKTYADDVAAADKAKKTAEDEADADVKNANNATARALSALEALTAQAALDPTNETLAAQKAAAQKTYNDAKAVSDAAPKKASDAKAAAAKAYDKAVAAAETKKVNSINAANEALDTAYKTYASSGEMVPEIDAAYKAMNEAQTAYDNYVNEQEKPAWVDAEKVANALVAAINKQRDEINYYNMTYRIVTSSSTSVSGSPYIYYNALQSWIYGWPTEFPTAVAPILQKDRGVYFNAKRYLSDTSYWCFGQLLTTYDPDNGYQELTNEAMLIDNVTREMVNEYIKKYNPNIPPYLYDNFYRYFGSYGQTLYLEDRIAIAKAYLANTNIINEVTKTLQTNLDALNKSYTDAMEDVEKIEKEKEAVDEEITNLTNALIEKHNDLAELGRTLSRIIGTIQKAIAKVEFPENKGELLPEILKDLNDGIEDYTGYLANWNKKLEKAQYQLDQYNNGYTDIENPLKITADYFQQLLIQAGIEVDFAKAHLDELQAQYDAATKQQ